MTKFIQNSSYESGRPLRKQSTTVVLLDEASSCVIIGPTEVVVAFSSASGERSLQPAANSCCCSAEIVVGQRTSTTPKWHSTRCGHRGCCSLRNLAIVYRSLFSVRRVQQAKKCPVKRLVYPFDTPTSSWSTSDHWAPARVLHRRATVTTRVRSVCISESADRPPNEPTTTGKRFLPLGFLNVSPMLRLRTSVLEGGFGPQRKAHKSTTAQSAPHGQP